MKIGNPNSKTRGEQQDPATHTGDAFLQRNKGQSLSSEHVGSPRHTGTGPRNRTLQGFLPQALGLHCSKRKEQGGHISPRNSWRQSKRNFLSSKWASETILQKPKDVVIFHSSARESVVCFPSSTGYLSYPNKNTLSSLPFLPAVFLTLLTER